MLDLKVRRGVARVYLLWGVLFTFSMGSFDTVKSLFVGE